MFNYPNDGVVISTVLGARTINKEGKYPVKIKGYYQKRPKYDSIGLLYDTRRMEQAAWPVNRLNT
jgi:hypothetical protein